MAIAWGDGTENLAYIVRVPDTEPPKIIGSTVKDGDIIDPRGLDPDAIHTDPNADARIVITFSEDVPETSPSLPKAAWTSGVSEKLRQQSDT